MKETKKENIKFILKYYSEQNNYITLTWEKKNQLPFCYIKKYLSNNDRVAYRQ